MADLGTLWFGADIKLDKLRESIQKGNQTILDALKMDYDPASFNKMLEKIQGELNNKTFNIQLSADGKAVTQAVGNIDKAVGSLGQAGKGGTIAPFDIKNIEAAAQGVGGIRGYILELSKLIEAQRVKTRNCSDEVVRLREAWRQAVISNGRTSDLATNIYSLYSAKKGELQQERRALFDLTEARRQANIALQEQNLAQRESASVIKSSTDAMKSQSQVLSDLKSLAMQYVSIWGAKSFLDNVIEVGGLLEKQRISMGAIIGDTARANELFEQIKDMAIQSPFGVVELDQYSKQLAAYGIEQSKLFDMTKRLADISAGAGQDIGRLALALGHVKSATYLTGITLRQFSMNNIPMLKMLADYYTEVEHRAVSTAEVQKRISKRQVSYEDVIEQIRRMTDEGGQFYNMQEKISESLQSKFKNLRDSLDIMYGEIAESKVGALLKELAGLLTSLSRNWKEVMTIVGAGAAIWGTYRASLIAINQALTVNSTRLGVLATMTRNLTSEQVQELVVSGKLQKEHLLNAVASGRLSVEQAKLAAETIHVTEAQLRQVATSGKVNAGLISNALATSRYSVAQLRMIANMRIAQRTAIALGGRFKWLQGALINLRLVGIGAANMFKTAFAFVGRFAPQIAVFAAITTAIDTFAERSRKAEEAEERLKSMAETANEAFNNLEEVRNKFKVGASGGMSNDELQTNITEMIEHLQNYSKTATETFNHAFEVDAEGKSVHSLSEQYEILAKAVEDTAEAYRAFNEMRPMVERALNVNNPDTNWFVDFGLKIWGWLFSEDYKDPLRDLSEGLELYATSVKEASDAEQLFLRNRLDVQSALTSLGYKEAADMNNESLLTLIKTIKSEAPEAFRSFYQLLNNDGKDALNSMLESWERMDSRYMEAARKMKSSGDDLYQSMVVRFETSDMTKWPDNWREQVMIAMDMATKDVKGWSDLSIEYQNLVRDYFLKPFGITVNTDEAMTQVNNLMVELENLVGKDWIVRLGIKGESSIEDVASNEKVYKQAVDDIASTTARLNKLEKEGKKNTEAYTQTLKDNVDAIARKSKAEMVLRQYGADLPKSKGETAEEIAARKAEAQAAKEAKMRQNQFEARVKEEEEQAKRLRELDDVIAELNVASIENKGERERAQEDLEHEKRLRQIRQQAEEWRKANYEAQKKVWEADHANDKKNVWADTSTAQQVLRDGNYSSIGLTADQLRQYEAMMELALKIWENKQEERRRLEEKSNREAINKYIKEYGDYTQKRQAIESNLAAELEEIERDKRDKMTEEEEKAIEARINTAKKGAEKEIEELDVLYGKAKAFMIDLFEDASKKTASEIEFIIKKYEALIKFLSGKEVITKDQLITDFGFSKSEINKAIEQLSSGKIQVKDFTDAVEKLNDTLGDKSPWAKLRKDYEEAINNIKEAREKLQAAMSPEGQEAGLSALNIVEKYGTLFEIFGESTKMAADGLEDFGVGMANIFNVDDSQLKQATKTLRDFGGILNGIGQIVQGNYVGGAISILSSLGSIFGYLDEGDTDNVLQSINSGITVLNERMDRLSEALEKNYGIAAQELAERQRETLARKQEKLKKGAETAGITNIGVLGGLGVIAKRISDELNLGIDFGDENHTFEFGWDTFFDKYDASELAKIFYDLRESGSYLWEIVTDETTKWGTYIKQLAESYDELENINLSEKMQITGTSFENVVDDMVDALYNLADGSEDATEEIAENFEKMMNRMVINNILRSQLEKDLKEWYEAWYEAWNGDKNISEAEREALDKRYNEIFANYAGQIEELKKQGIIKTIEEGTEESKKYFDGLLNSWKSTLTDITKSTEDWKDELIDTVFADLVEKTILNVEFKVATTEIEKGEQTFADFAAYLDDWTRRYTDVINGSYENEAERIAAINALIKEQTDVREQLAEDSKEIAAGLGKDISEAFSNSLDNLGDTLLDTLLDAEKDAKQMGAEIGKTLVQEMLKEILASEKYAPQIDAIKQLWQNILKSDKGWWSDSEGVFGPKGAVYTLDSVIAKITELNNAIADDKEIQTLTDAFNKFDETLKQATSSFGDLHDTFMDAVFDMEDGAASLSKKLRETLAKDLVDKKVFAEAFSLNGVDYANFEEYQKKWTERYLDALEKGDEALLNELVKELEEREAAMAESAEKYVKAIQEATKDTTFTDMESDFVSALMDMDGDIEDFANDMKKTIVRKLIESFMVSEQIKPILEELQETFNYVMSLEGLSMEDRAEIMTWGDANHRGINEFDNEMNDMKAIVDAIMKALGFTKSETETLFSNLGDSIINILKNTENGVESLMDSITETIVDDIAKQYMATEEYQKRLEDVRKELEAAAQRVADAQKAMQGLEEGTEEWENANKELQEANAQLEEAKENTKDFAEQTVSELKDVTDALKKAKDENDTTFKDMGSDLLSALMDFGTSAEDWVKELGKKMAQRLFEGLMTESKLLENIQDSFNNAVKAATDSEGKVDWSKVVNNTELHNSVEKSKEEFDEYKKAWEAFCNAWGIEPEYSNTLDNLKDTLVDRLLSLDDDLEDVGKQFGETLMREMLEKMFEVGPFADRIAAIRQMWQDILTRADTEHTWQDVVNDIAQLEADLNNPDNAFAGLVDAIKKLNEEVSEIETSFGNMRDTVLDSLMDVGSSVDDFRNKLEQTLVKDMMEKMVLDVPLTVEIGDESIVFDNFDEYRKEFEKRYLNIWNAENLTQEEKIQYLDRLIDELVGVEQDMVLASEDIRERLKKATDSTFSDMADSWASSLMGMKDTAEDWAKEVGRTIASKIVSEMVVPTLIKPLLDSLQKAMNTALAAENATLQTVIDAALPYIGKITDAYTELQPVVEQIMNSFGIFREEVEEAEEEVEYALQDMKSDFVSSLMDIEATAEERGKSISRTLAESFIRNFVLGEAFDAQMKAWQQQYENIRNGGLSEDERRRQIIQLRDAIAAAKEGYVNESRAIQELLGLNNAEDQKATANIADKITNEQADQLLGINMAQEMTLEQILDTIRGGVNLRGGATATYGTVAGQEALNAQILSTLQGMQNATSVTGTSSDIFNRLGYTNEYLRAIRDSNQSMLEQFGNVLGQINSKLSRL